MKKKSMISLIAGLLLASLALSLGSCTENIDPEETTLENESTVLPHDTEEDATDTTEAQTDPVQESAPSETVPESETVLESETADMEETTNKIELNVDMSDLQDIMRPLFNSTYTMNETVMFIDRGEIKSLLYPIESITSVTSYDGTIVYQEGRDYVLEDGNIRVTADSTIPCITSDVYYNWPEGMLVTQHNGEAVNTFWGESQPTQWQVCVNYSHTAAWDGFVQECKLDVYAPFVEKLQAGQDVTVFFYGDSITHGANASYTHAPYQPPYPILFTQALADLFNYTVEYVRVDLPSNVPEPPRQAYVGGDGSGGTIRYVNTAVGGWTSQNGLDNVQTFVCNQIQRYGCDLFIVGFGMNDGSVKPGITKETIKRIAHAALQESPDTGMMLISTMVPNPDAVNGWYGNQEQQEPALLALADEYRAKGVSCAVAQLTSVSKAVLTRKKFIDYTGNNINHPNDFFGRVYAQTLLQTLIGYENMA